MKDMAQRRRSNWFHWRYANRRAADQVAPPPSSPDASPAEVEGGAQEIEKLPTSTRELSALVPA